MAYAERTEVPIEKSIAEIIGMLKRAGAERIGQLEEPERFTIQFFMNDRMIRFRIPLPRIEEMPTRNGNNVTLTNSQRLDRLAQAGRQRGRALMLVIKAKLESIESAVETFEEAFLANVVMADGHTLYDRVREPIALEYDSGKVAPLMLGGPNDGR